MNNIKKNSKKKIMIMGILNLTPDSFSDGSKYNKQEKALEQVSTMIQEGADIIDIGGESTRPGSKEVSQEVELDRVESCIKKIRKKYPKILLSIDTYKSEVARRALDLDVNIINDIWGCSHPDHDMWKVAGEYKCPIIIMHGKAPKTQYDIVNDIIHFFDSKINEALKRNIDIKKIIFDPGIGFGKTPQDNIEVLKRIHEIRSKVTNPLLLGISRKSFLGIISGEDDPSKRDSSTIATSILCLENKIDILRVHNVKANIQALQAWTALNK